MSLLGFGAERNWASRLIDIGTSRVCQLEPGPDDLNDAIPPDGTGSIAVVRVGVGQAVGEPVEHLDTDARRRHQHRLELTAVEHQQLHSGLGDDVGRPDASVEEGKLAEVAAGRESVHLAPPQPARGDPGEHEEELPTDRALCGQHLPLLDAYRCAELSDGAEFALRASGEEGHGLEQIDLLLWDSLSDVITSAQCELPGSVSGSVPLPTTPVYGLFPRTRCPSPADLIAAAFCPD